MRPGRGAAARRPGTGRAQRIARWLFGAAIAYAIVRGAEGALRALPPGMNVDIAPMSADDVVFLADTTGVSASGDEPATGAPLPTDVAGADRARVVDQHIFDAVFELITGAREGVLIDMFLYNRWQGAQPERTRPLASELTQTVLAQKAALPDLDVILITDPINTVYGSVPSPDLDALRAAGVTVVVTDLTRLPDSNPLWSGPWRAFIQPFGRRGTGWLPNPFDPSGPRVTARGWFELLNFKANHRKVVVADTPEGPAAIVTSANPHDGSSAHGNVALRVRGPVVGAIVESERAVADMSGMTLPAMAWAASGATSAGSTPSSPAPSGDGVRVGLITERAIRKAVVLALDAATEGDRVDIAMFYLSDRLVIRAIQGAAERGAAVRVLLDPNKDAFGRTKNGVPNRPVAAELRRTRGIDVRWCDTHGEQCHAKLVLARRTAGASESASPASERATLILGSANLTRRNIGGLNLETNLVVAAPASTPALLDATAYFERVWANASGGAQVFSADYDAYADASWTKRWLYRFMEATGVSTF